MENCNKYSVYYHIFPNGKKYVGMTSKENVEDRWNKGNGYYDQPVYKAIQKYGWDNIEHHIYAQNLSEVEAHALENKLITEWDTLIQHNKGYNVSTGEYFNCADVARKEISQYDIMGNLIKTFPSAQDAANELQCSASSLGEVCNDIRALSQGFLWAWGHEAKIKPLKDIQHKVLKIDQFDLQGNFLQTFNNAMEAGRLYSNNNRAGIHIVDVCRGKRRSCFGFQWRYHYEGNNDCIAISPIEKIVGKYNLQGELINTYPSVNEAARQNNTDKTLVSRQCRGSIKTTGKDFFFRFGNALKVEPMERYIDKLKCPINAYDNQTREYVKTYKSNAEAALELTGKKLVGNITSAVTGKRNNAYGYIWSYIKWDIAPENYRELNKQFYENYKEGRNKQI